MSDTIVEVGGKKYREVKRVAKVGELIRVTVDGEPFFHTGQTGVVKNTNPVICSADFSSNEDVYKGGAWNILHHKYVVLEPVESLSVEQRLSALEDAINRLIVEFNKHIDGSKHDVSGGDTAEVDDGVWKPDDGIVLDGVVHKSPWTREEVVEYAKHDMARLKDRWFDVRFVENREKGKITALLSNSSGDIVRVGRSRVSKSDCFNIHIGRVIALRRALYDEVSDYYTNAPQPTRAQEGDIVEYDGETYKIDNRKEWFLEHAHKDSQVGRYGHIIDDSHDFGGDDN